MKKLLLLLFVLAIQLSVAQESWKPLGPSDVGDDIFGVSPRLSSMVMSTNNEPYFIYTEYIDRFNSKPLVCKIKNNRYETVGKESLANDLTGSSYPGFGSVALDKNNTPYIAFVDNNNSGKITVKKYNGLVWELVGTSGLSGSAAWQFKFLISADNTPYVFYQESSGISVEKFNGKNWEVVSKTEFNLRNSDAQNHNLSEIIGVNNKNEIFIHQRDPSNGWLKIYKFNGSTWDLLGGKEVDQIGLKVTMAFDKNGILYVAYYNKYFSSFEDPTKLLLKKFNNGSWEVVSTQIVNSSIGNYNDQESKLKLLLDKNDVPYIFRKITFGSTTTEIIKFNGTTWDALVEKDVSAVSSSLFECALDTNNIPYVLSSNPQVVKKVNGSSWEVIGVNGVAKSNVRESRIAVDKNNSVLVAYSDYGDKQRVKVKKFNGVNWEQLGLPLSEGYGYSPELKIDNNGIPYVVYLENGYKIIIKKYINNTWVVVSSEGLSSDYSYSNCTLFFDNANNPVLTYKEYTFSNIENYKPGFFIRKFNGKSWELINNNSSFTQSASSSYLTEYDKVNDTYYILTRDYSDKNNVTDVMKKFKNGVWDTLVGQEVYSKVQNASIKLDKKNDLYIVYTDKTNNNKLNVQKLVGNQWQMVGNASSLPSDLFFLKLDFDSKNTPYLSAQTNPINSFQVVYKFNGTDWDKIGEKISSSSNLNYSDMLINNNDVPVVAYTGTADVFVSYFGKESYILDTQNFISTGANNVVYPNPVNNILNISGNFTEASVFDYLGRLIKTTAILDNKIDLTDLVSGNYILKLQSGSAQQTVKIVKE